MLNIILNKSSISEDKYVYDVERYFPYVLIKDNDITRAIIEEIDKGTYLSADSFIDRCGCKLSTLNLSTGSKVLLTVDNTDKIINGSGIGQNAFELLIQSVDGYVYFNNVDRFRLPEYLDVKNILVDGESSNTVLELENKIWKE